MWNFFVVVLAVIFYCYTSDFYQKVQPLSYSAPLPKKLTGVLAVNNALEKAERLHENKLYWPESFAVHQGSIYTGLGDGRIVRVTDKKFTEVAQIGKKCAGVHEEHICGRPLGLCFSKSGNLYVADAYHGLFSVNIKTGKKENILSANTVIEDFPLTFMNALTLDEEDQVIYFTQSSSRWNISMVMVSILEHDTSGRLLKFDLKNKELTVLQRSLSFPNGVVLTNDGKALLVAEGNNHKIFKYHIKGKKEGLNEELPIVLPGEPDNLSRNPRGNYWVGIASGRSEENPQLHDRLQEYPIVRNVILHVHRLLTAPVDIILNFLPYDRVKEISAELRTLRLIADFLPSHGMIVEFDENGKIIQSLQSPTGSVTHISEVLEHNGYLYLGSWRNHYLGRLKL